METQDYKNLANYELPELKRKGLFRWQYTPTQTPVRKMEYYFSDDVADVKAILEQRQFHKLSQLTCKTLSPTGLLVIGTKDGQFAAAQVRRYVPYEFKPETEIMVYHGAEAEALLERLKELKPIDKGLF